MDVDLGSMGKLAVPTAMEFERMEEIDGTQNAKLRFSGTISGTMEPAPGVSMKVGEGSKQEGTFHFDPMLGQITKVEMDSIFNMEMAGIESKAKQKTIQKLLSVEDIKE